MSGAIVPSETRAVSASRAELRLPGVECALSDLELGEDFGDRQQRVLEGAAGLLTRIVQLSSRYGIANLSA